jgi:hypothetical protein
MKMILISFRIRKGRGASLVDEDDCFLYGVFLEYGRGGELPLLMKMIVFHMV